MLFVCNLVGTNISKKKISRQIPVSQILFFKHSYQNFSSLHTTQTYLPLPSLNSPFQRSSPLPKPVFPTSPLLLYNNFTISKNSCSTNAKETNPLELEVRIEQNEVNKWTPSQVQHWLKGTMILEDQMISDHFANVNGDAFLKLTFKDMSEELAESLILKRLELKNEDEWSRKDVYVWVKKILITEFPDQIEEMIKQAKILDEQIVNGKILLTLTEDKLVEGYKLIRGPAATLAKHIEEINLMKQRLNSKMSQLPVLNNFAKVESYYLEEEKNTLTKSANRNFGEYFTDIWKKISKRKIKSKKYEYTAEEIKSFLRIFYKENKEPLPVIRDLVPVLYHHRLPYIESYQFSNNNELKDDWEHLILIASTGSGKTGAVLRYLCKNHGIYFSCIEGGDFKNISVVKDVVDRSCGRLHSFLLMKGNNSIPGYIRRACLMLIIVRIQMLLDKINNWKRKERNRINEEIKIRKTNGESVKELQEEMDNLIPPPGKFLRWQMNGANEIESQRLSILLIEYEILSMYNYMNILGFARNLVSQLSFAIGKKFALTIDEAQEFCNSKADFEVYSKNGKPRKGALLSVLVWMLIECTDSYPIATLGTAYTEEHAEIHMSYASKVKTLVLVPKCKLIDNAQQVESYLELHITIPDNCKIWLRSKEFGDKYLPLRIRTLAVVIGELILKGFDGEFEKRTHLEIFQSSFESAVENMVKGLREKIITKGFYDRNFDDRNFLNSVYFRYFDTIGDEIDSGEKKKFCEWIESSGILHYTISIRKMDDQKILNVDARGPYLPLLVEEDKIKDSKVEKDKIEDSKVKKKFKYASLARECAKHYFNNKVDINSETNLEFAIGLNLIAHNGKSLNELKWLHPDFRGDHKLVANIVLESSRVREYLSKYLVVPDKIEIRKLLGWDDKQMEKKLQMPDNDLEFFWALMKAEYAVFLEGIIVKLSNNCHVDLAFVQFREDPSEYRRKIETQNFYAQNHTQNPSNDENNNNNIEAPSYYLSCWAVKLLSTESDQKYKSKIYQNIAQSRPNNMYQANLKESAQIKDECNSQKPIFLESVDCLSVALEMHANNFDDNLLQFSSEMQNLTMISCSPNNSIEYAHSTNGKCKNDETTGKCDFIPFDTSVRLRSIKQKLHFPPDFAKCEN